MYLDKGKDYPKVIMLSAVEDRRLSKRCYEEKIVDIFMIKPAQNSVLEESINSLLQICPRVTAEKRLNWIKVIIKHKI